MAHPVTRISKPYQINDMIAVRLFVFNHSGTTKRLAPGAYGWAKRRRIEVAICEKSQLFFILPEEYTQYLEWSRTYFESPALKDIFNVSLDIVCETGWATVKRYIRPFDVSEKTWLLNHAPNHYGWLIR